MVRAASARELARITDRILSGTALWSLKEPITALPTPLDFIVGFASSL